MAESEVGEAAIVDPGTESGLFLARLAHEGWRLAAIWLTHAHLDHVAGVAAVKAATGAPVYLHAADGPLYGGLPGQAEWMGLHAEPPPAPDRALADGDALRLGGAAFRVLHTPGHTPGGVSFLGEGIVFVGDALFAGSIGRTDLPGGDTGTLLASIRERLLVLPEQTVVYAGHGPATTIGEERRTNPFLTGAYRLA